MEPLHLRWAPFGEHRIHDGDPFRRECGGYVQHTWSWCLGRWSNHGSWPGRQGKIFVGEEGLEASRTENSGVKVFCSLSSEAWGQGEENKGRGSSRNLSRETRCFTLPEVLAAWEDGDTGAAEAPLQHPPEELSIISHLWRRWPLPHDIRGCFHHDVERDLWRSARMHQHSVAQHTLAIFGIYTQISFCRGCVKPVEMKWYHFLVDHSQPISGTSTLCRSCMFVF